MGEVNEFDYYKAERTVEKVGEKELEVGTDRTKNGNEEDQPEFDIKNFSDEEILELVEVNKKYGEDLLDLEGIGEDTTDAKAILAENSKLLKAEMIDRGMLPKETEAVSGVKGTEAPKVEIPKT